MWHGITEERVTNTSAKEGMLSVQLVSSIYSNKHQMAILEEGSAVALTQRKEELRII